MSRHAHLVSLLSAWPRESTKAGSEAAWQHAAAPVVAKETRAAAHERHCSSHTYRQGECARVLLTTLELEPARSLSLTTDCLVAREHRGRL